MYISMVEFTVTADDKAQFANKIKNDVEKLKAVDGVISTEAWVNERATKTTYALVTKWIDEQAQKTWINRPEHVAHHKKMSQELKAQPEKKKNIEKKVSGYQLF